MPSYKTHSIHGELILPCIDKMVDISNEDIKIFCVGPDTMIATDYKTFDYQHANKTKEYFETLIKLVKENKLQDNSGVMAFVYGQIDHYILDIVMHPYIYYITEGLPRDNFLIPHSLIEMWIDDYIMKKFNKDEKKYYKKIKIRNSELKHITNKLYLSVYDKSLGYIKYKYGLKLFTVFDLLIRRNSIKIIPWLTKKLNIGDITYHNDFNKAIPYLNLDGDVWYNPETGEESQESFEDLWQKSKEIALETICDINGYLYSDKAVNNPYILNNISYNTGLSCEKGQSFQYIKKY